MTIRWIVIGHRCFSQILVIPKIPVVECAQCGEQYMNVDASKHIDEQIEKFRLGELESGLEVNIRKIRTQKGFTQQDVAKRLGFTVARFTVAD